MRSALVASSFLILSLSGCGVIPRGLLYTDTIQPLCKDLRGSSLGQRSASGASKRVAVPTTKVDLSAEWDSRAIGDIGKRYGIQNVYGCDSRSQAYVLGIWQEDEVIIYGE